MKIYFAGSIRGGRDDQEDYLRIIEMLKDFGEVLTEHIGDKSLSSGGEDLSSSEIYRRDIEWLQHADIFVAEASKPSLGVGFEICYSCKVKAIPVLCLFREENGKHLSAMVEGNPSVTICTYKSIKDIPRILLDFFS